MYKVFLKNFIPLFCIIFILFFLNTVFNDKKKTKKVQINEGANEYFDLKDVDNVTLKYFGSSYCPHSNENSIMFKLINDGFRNFLERNSYNCSIEIIWSTQETQIEFIRAKANYVPTLTNQDYKHVTLDRSIENPDDMFRKLLEDLT
uniref:Uncharacterized protein n=1 Tax=Megaviridae environmental sample TaxID=1737588 RepID=A0A5J6VMA5_9VIRU|nr:MAG: hypothetical protein [Megaviridae environmental sample]